MMDKKKKVTTIILVVLCIGLVISLLSATTYALFSVDVYGTNPNNYSTGMLSIEAKSKSEIISLTSALPMTDDDGKSTNPYVFTIKNTGNLDYEFDVKLLSTSSNTFSSDYIRLQVDDGEVATLSSLTNSIIKSKVNLAAGESVDISLRVWLSIDTPNTELGKNFECKIVTDGQAVYTESNNDYVPSLVTPLSDFNYFLGSEYSVVDTINYYDSDTDAYYDISVAPMTLQSNEVLLVKYKGESKDVYVPDTYTVDGVTYNVVVLSLVYINYNDADIDNDDGIFEYNTSIESVTLGKNIKFIDNDGHSSVTENSMRSMFFECTSLINAPEIPSSVTNMYSTFTGCTSLTGTVEINSSSVSSASYIFYNTTNAINVLVPSGSTTYTTFSGLTTSNGMPSNVTLSTY